MTVKTGSAWVGLFVTLDATGALATPSTGPAGVLYVDGTANAAEVTITGTNPYKFAVTLPALTAGQRVDMYITATIATIATASVVASEQADTEIVSDIYDAMASVGDIWDEATSGHTDAGSFGKAVADVLEDTATTIPATLVTIDDFLDTEVAAILADTNELQVEFVDGGRLDLLIDAIKAKTDNLPADPADDSDIDSQLAAIKAETALIVADTGTDGVVLKAAGLAADAVAEIADGVWDEAMAGHVGAGTAGKLAADVLEDSGTTIPADLVDIENKIDVIAMDTTTEIPASITALDGKIDTIDNYIDTEVSAIKAKTDNLPSDPASNTVVNTRLSSGAYVAPANADIAAIKAKTDNLPASPADQSELEVLIAALPSASSIATAVWSNAARTLTSFGTLIADVWGYITRTITGGTITTNSDKSGYTLTTGERTAIADEVEAQIINEADAERVLTAITDKIASVNPSLDDLTLAGIASAVRTELATELARIDAAISSRLASVGYTAPDNASVTAIKAKTDNLPVSPAAVGSAMTLTAAYDRSKDDVLTPLSVVDGIVDEIKAKTDNLPSDPADQSAVEAAITAGIGTIPAGITAEDVMTAIVEGAVTLRDSLKLANAMNAGKVSGGNTAAVTFRDLADTLDRIIMTVDVDGNRTVVAKDYS